MCSQALNTQAHLNCKFNGKKVFHVCAVLVMRSHNNNVIFQFCFDILGYTLTSTVRPFCLSIILESTKNVSNKAFLAFDSVESVSFFLSDMRFTDALVVIKTFRIFLQVFTRRWKLKIRWWKLGKNICIFSFLKILLSTMSWDWSN